MVFEEYSTPIEFPVPFLNHFVRFRFNEDHARYIGHIVRDNMPSQKYMALDVVKCSNPKCNAVFNYWSLWVEMHCPVCTKKLGADTEENMKRGNRYRYMPANIV